MSETERTVEDFLKDPEEAKKEILKLQQSNRDKQLALGSAGRGMDLGYLANLKVDTVIELFLDDSTALVYLYRLEKKIKAALDEALTEIRKQQISQNGGKLIVPGR